MENLPSLLFSSTEVYLTFYTRGLNVGNKYDLKLMNIENLMETEFTEALEIINGVQGALKMQIDSQARLLVGETGTITVSVQNSGDTDVVAPIMVMEVSGVLPLSYHSFSSGTTVEYWIGLNETN